MTVAQSHRFSTAINPINISLLSKQILQLGRTNHNNNSDSFTEISHQSKLLYQSLDDCINLNQIKQVHGHVIRKGLDQSCYILTKLIRTLTKLGVPMDPYPRRVIEPVQFRNPFLWTAVIRGYTIQGKFDEAISMYGCMRKEGITPLSFTFSALLKACGSLRDLKLGQQFHAQTFQLRGFCIVYVGNTMIDMYVKCGSIDCARKVFDEMPERDVISWTDLISAYGRVGNMESAVELFERLPIKDMVAWTAMVTGFVQNAKPQEALEYFDRMEKSGVRADEFTVAGFISACAQLGVSKYTDQAVEIAKKSGCSARDNVFIGSALIDMYSKCGNVEEAVNVFESMNYKNVFSYSSMILGLAMHGRAQEALELFDYMVSQTAIKPNTVTFVGALTACSHTGLVDQGRQIFAYMHQRFGVEPTSDHYTCMVDLLGRAGRLQEALELIKTMPVESHGGVWGALLGACRIHKNPDIAEIAAKHLFELEPNIIGNYILLSNVYASAGDLDGVLRVRKLIKEKRLKKTPAVSWVVDKNGRMHRFFPGNMNHPMSNKIQETLEKLVERLKVLGYQPDLSSVPYDMSDDAKRLILIQHTEKLALAFCLLTTNRDSTIKIMKNLRMCQDCHTFMRLASEVTGRVIIMRDNMRFHHFRSGACSCGDFW
ncbi:Pentatricopeptide repeat-containing protein [Cardamine amara subsp. amara]|uniref:Pentatricopeptide repeat-containing protein n=1 Tax=Cardamine amara subsp. amara TaxID=228776 RepID=A0ABD1A6Y8_CARAN